MHATSYLTETWYTEVHSWHIFTKRNQRQDFELATSHTKFYTKFNSNIFNLHMQITYWHLKLRMLTWRSPSYLRMPNTWMWFKIKNNNYCSRHFHFLILQTSICSILTMVYLMRVEARDFVRESVCTLQLRLSFSRCISHCSSKVHPLNQKKTWFFLVQSTYQNLSVSHGYVLHTFHGFVCILYSMWQVFHTIVACFLLCTK